MSDGDPIRKTIYEDQSVLFRCRFADSTGIPYKQTGITSLKYDAFQLVPYSATALANDTALVVASTISDTLQPWSVDATGYNFSTTFPYTLSVTRDNRGTAAKGCLGPTAGQVPR